MYTSRSSACPQLAEVIDNTDNNDPSRSRHGNGSDDDRVSVTHSVVLKEVTSRAADTSCLKDSKMGSNSVRTRLYFIVSLWVIVETTTNHAPKQIVDGILISGGTSQNAIQVLDSVWTIHVAVGSISDDIQLAPLISRLQELITGFSATTPAEEVTRSIWQQRLQIIRSTAPSVVTPHDRRRRGLINVGGQILHSLFGLATSNQVQISRQMINIIRKSNKHIIHQSNNMISVINQTYTEMKLNRRHIIDVEESLSALYEHVNTWITGRQTAWSRISSSLQVDRIFDLLDSAQILYDKRQRHYHAQRDALQTGRLTEALLPNQELGKILKHCNALGLFTTRSEWYYEYVTVTPLWRSDNEMGYIAHIPLANHATFLLYKIETWPFLHVASNTTLQIELPPQIAYDTRQGLMFVPHTCVGRRPQICHTGPIYQKNHFSCIRGVLTNDVTLRDTCKVTIHRHNTITESIIEVQPNTYLIVSEGGELKLFCDGLPQRTVNLPPGSATIHVSPKCRLTNDRWLVTGVSSFDINITLTTPAVPIIAFNWSSMISKTQIHAHLKARKWRAFPSIKHVSLAKIQDPLSDVDDEQWSLTVTSTSYFWLFIILIALLGVALAILGAYINIIGSDFSDPVNKHQMNQLLPTPLKCRR